MQFLPFLVVFAQFIPFFAHILCANFSGLMLCLCYLVSFFQILFGNCFLFEIIILQVFEELLIPTAEREIISDN